MNIFENVQLINYDETLVESFKNNNTWKYKTPLHDATIFDDIEKALGMTIPDCLRTFIKKYNGATPSKCHFKIGSDEYKFMGVLSYNTDDDDNDVFGPIRVINNKSLTPFAVENDIGYICISIPDNNVVLFNDGNGNIYNTNKNLDDFINSLY